jgi:hypothetical protein
MDGHPNLTYSYSIYKNNGFFPDSDLSAKESTLHLENQNDPDLYGCDPF